jgi:hypothetical protein
MNMPRKKKLTPAEQEQKEAEALNASVRIDGAGEHPAVQALMSPEFEKMSNMDASQIALLLQQIVRGQNSLLEQNSIQIAQLRERQDQADREIAERFESQQKFINDVLNRAEDLQRTGIERDKLIAEGVATYQKAKENATANLAAKNLQYAQQLAKEPKVMVISPGQLVTTMEHGQQVVKIINEEVRIKDKVWRLPIGIPVEVPKSIAEFLSQRRASQTETAKRSELLSKNLEANKLADEWNKIEGSKTESMPVG